MNVLARKDLITKTTKIRFLYCDNVLTIPFVLSLNKGLAIFSSVYRVNQTSKYIEISACT